MGATAAERLATRYGALDARRAVVLGSGAEARSAIAALQSGRRDGGRGGGAGGRVPRCDRRPAVLAPRHGCGRRAWTTSRPAVLAPLDDAGRPIAAAATAAVACDTIVLGVGVVPVIELTDAIGCRNVFDPARGGHVPVTDPGPTRPACPASTRSAIAPACGSPRRSTAAVAEAEGRRAAAHLAGQAADPAPAPACAGLRPDRLPPGLGQGRPWCRPRARRMSASARR